MNLRKRFKMMYEARLKAQRDQWAIEDAIKEDSMAAGMEQGLAQGDLRRSRQTIFDLLEDLGEIPNDIHNSVIEEKDVEVLRRWHKLAARAESFEDFRRRIG